MSEFTDGLRELADFYDARPDLQEPINHTARIYVWTPEELAAQAAVIGKAHKWSDESYLGLKRMFGPVGLQVYTLHDTVCERVVVGTRQVERKVVPEGVELVTVVEDEEVVEWRCPESILAARGEYGGDAVPTDDDIDERQAVAS